jgi:hypothetical protein
MRVPSVITGLVAVFALAITVTAQPVERLQARCDLRPPRTLIGLE